MERHQGPQKEGPFHETCFRSLALVTPEKILEPVNRNMPQLLYKQDPIRNFRFFTIFFIANAEICRSVECALEWSAVQRSAVECRALEWGGEECSAVCSGVQCAVECSVQCSTMCSTMCSAIQWSVQWSVECVVKWSVQRSAAEWVVQCSAMQWSAVGVKCSFQQTVERNENISSVRKE